ncbi:SDR family NAD(P)-dependent oxidoreductase [Streptomyces yaizuensis]|uniref:SDR family oxidoreductase n=1 Tax=Streptomyces yaizuensis TaxID=2989713 RepID=A0ABQ5PB53_9ACTN|nr:SDR family NAD(P)-dependent oxidoreductase [Streptomyces sp. YSPA8]GLF99713.1 SDR family oxidoreductase [Streptomyces sp. YSPA8]
MPLTAYDLSGRTALVTGAASGIGRASAVLLARAGASVHCADIDEKGLARTLELIDSDGDGGPGRGRSLTLDVTDRSAVAAAVAGIVAGDGRLDIAAAVAGIMFSASALETTDEDFDRVLAVNTKGVLYTCQESARAMIGRGIPGSIVTVASTAVDMGHPGTLAYSASKAAVVQLTRTFATELGPRGIRVNSVAPGWIRTPMTTTGEAGDDHARAQAMAKRSPLGRPGEPDEVAHTVLHLASDASSFTTGQVIRPNGGATMPW